MVLPDDSKYYNTKSAKTGDKIRIISEPKLSQTKFGDKVVCMIERDGRSLEWTVGNAAKASLISYLGNETKDWMKYFLEVKIKTDRPLPYIDVEPTTPVSPAPPIPSVSRHPNLSDGIDLNNPPY